MDSQDTRTLEALKALKALGHSKGTWALRHSRHLGTWALEALRHSGTHALKGHLGTWPLRHSGTWTLEAPQALYLTYSKYKRYNAAKKSFLFFSIHNTRDSF